MRIDLNADVGEGMDDAPLFALVTSVNVACGGHAGDSKTMEECALLGAKHSVHLGAHPSYPDRANFGRVPVAMLPEKLEDAVEQQVRALLEIVRRHGIALSHVKPHGALYHDAGGNPEIAARLVAAVHRVDSKLIVVGPPRSRLAEAAQAAGLRFVAEGFADRRYRRDGGLVPRGNAAALITDADAAAGQAMSIVRDHTAIAADGSHVHILVETICLHSDTPGAIQIARRVRGLLEKQGVAIAPP